MKRVFTTIIFSVCLGFTTMAQEDVPNSPNGGSQKMMFPGYAVTMYQYNNTPGVGASHNFTPVGIGVFPIVKYNDRLFLDAAVTGSANSDGSTTFGLGELVGYYKINPYMTAFLGNFSPHFGVYLGILDDFTNHFGTGVAPVGMANALGNQNGVGLQGGFQCGYSKFTYQVYAANGPQMLLDSSGRATGQLDYGAYMDNNKNKSIGWHVGFLPFSNSSLELTFSGETAPKTLPASSSDLDKISATSMAVGMNYYHTFSPIMLRLTAEYNQVNISDYAYNWTAADTLGSTASINRTKKGWFAGFTLRPTGSESQFLKNVEVAARFGGYTPPKDAPWGGEPTTQTTISATYWLTWAIPFTLEYDVIKQNGISTQFFSTVLFFRF